MKSHLIFIMLSLLLLNYISSPAQSALDVKIIGAMKNVMWDGQLHGSIYLDTISNKTNLYGLGPEAYLRGEILIVNGKSYRSTVVSDTTMNVEETYNIEAPFFGYANIANWEAHRLPDRIASLHQLEQYLDELTSDFRKPYFFKMKGTVDYARIHVMNLPKNALVRSPDDAHSSQVNYSINKEPVEIIGFFSTKHQSIFTHHDTYVHMHLITMDRKKMGHVDDVQFNAGTMMLYLPID